LFAVEGSDVKPWTLVGSGPVPGGGGELRLYRRGEDFAIKVNNVALMGSRMHGSEAALAELGCRFAATRDDATVLIGGLGMGFTLAATLQQLDASAQIVVAELAPIVVEWNRSVIAHLAVIPLDDSRVTVFEGDVAAPMKKSPNSYDAILLDVDNGPEGLTRQENNWLYSAAGLQVAKRALKPGGVLGVWSEGPSPLFTRRLQGVGFAVEEAHPRFHGKGRGGRHTIWLATRSV
jgi:spermidine synthase